MELSLVLKRISEETHGFLSLENLPVILTIINILINVGFTMYNNHTQKMRQKKEDHLQQISSYRPKYIDQIRQPIAEYLESLDRIVRNDTSTSKEDYDNYRIKHFQLLSFMPRFGKNHIKATNLMSNISEEITIDKMKNKTERDKLNKKLTDKIVEADEKLRDIMDDNWLKTRVEVNADTSSQGNSNTTGETNQKH